ncbi:MAG: alpha/beta fold hydrolase, partial [Bacteroidota bacterium]
MKRFKRAVIAILAAYLFISVAMYLFQEKLIFLPTQLPQEYVYDFGRRYEELFVDTQDGARLNALHFPVDNAKGLILYFHGNAGDLSRWGEVVGYFEQFGYEVLVMDYRTYGKSTGKLGEEELYSDAILMYDKATEYFPEEQIAIYGRSLGTTFATYVAAHRDPSQLILEAPFYSLEHVASKRYWFLPVKPLLRYRFPTHEYLTHVSCPVTLLHGTNDGVVPYANSQRLFDSMAQPQLELITIEDGGHNDLVNFEAYRK